MSSDISTKRITGAGSVGVGPARVRQVQVLTNSTGAGRLTITDGDGGATLLDIDFKANDSHSINIPDYGVRFQEDVFITAFTNIDAITVFHA
jgi:hypothetical protein|tara:strand:+ start:487 stop:762 length:276 start_codon:yes stop_codon:yes gene_type:complete